MYDSSIWIAAFIIWLACGFGSSAIAKAKGRDPVGYFFLGFFLGLIGLIIAAAMPRVAAPARAPFDYRLHGVPYTQPRPPAAAPFRQPGAPGAEPAWEPIFCPNCGLLIQHAARFCRGCGFEIAPPVDDAVSRPAPGPAVETTARLGVIRRDVTVGGETAFSRGEQVNVEKVEPDPERPAFKYVVLSRRLNRRFRLSDDDVLMS